MGSEIFKSKKRHICSHSYFFHPPTFSHFCASTFRAVLWQKRSQEVVLVLVDCIELIFVHTSTLCDVREINTKEWDTVFQIFPTRVMHLEKWVKTSNSWISSLFFDLKEWIRISLAYTLFFSYWNTPCQNGIDYDIIWLKKASV